MNLDNSKYISETESGKYRVCFPSSMKSPRRLGVFETFDLAQAKRNEWLKEHGFLSECLPADIIQGQGKVIVGLYDLHYPYQDDRALAIASEIIKDVKPDAVILSEVIDFYKLSRFSQDEKRAKSVQKELDTWYDGAKQLKDTAKDATWYLIPGNHEYRLESYLRINSELASLRVLELGSLLRLAELGITKAQEIQYLNKELVWIHGNRVSINPGSAVKSEIKVRGWQQSVIQGHEHRQGYFIQNGPLRCIRGYSVGCLCQDAWYDASTTYWQRGAIVTTIGKTDFEAEPIRIVNNRCVFRGKVYKG